jgi:hypothetical protein
MAMFQNILSMVINQINVERVTLFKAKDNAPVAADTDAPKPFQVAFQRMKTPAGKQSYIPGASGFVDRQENVGYFLGKGDGNVPPLARFVKPL